MAGRQKANSCGMVFSVELGCQYIKLWRKKYTGENKRGGALTEKILDVFPGGGAPWIHAD